MKLPEGGSRLFDLASRPARSRVLVMGLGGAGCNIAHRMAESWTSGPDVVAVNTDVQALAGCGLSRTLAIGEKTTGGLGAAGEVGAGKLAADESAQALQEVLAGVDLLFLVAGLGGGTGTGAAPVVAKLARQQGALTLCFTTMPFPFEGERKRRLAEEGLRALQRSADAVVCLPNERLLKLVDEQAGLETAFRKSDEMLASGLHAIWYLLSNTGVINLSFADVRELAERCSGSLSFGYAEASGSARAATALRALMDSPLLERGRLLSEAKGLLVNITGGPDLTLSDLEGIMGQLTSMARDNAHISMGAIIDPAHREHITITLLAAENWNEDRFGDAAAAEDPAAKGGKGKPRAEGGGQPELPLLDQPQDRGAFGKTDPVFINGEDLDIPTYLRRGVKLSFER